MTSPVFELVRTVEVDLELGEELIPQRIELLRAVDDPTRFRCRIWELEYFRLRPTFPQDEAGEPEHESDDELLVERAHQLKRNYLDFTAPDEEAALQRVWGDLLERLEHWIGRKPVSDGPA